MERFLHRRVDELDAPVLPVPSFAADPRLLRFLSVMAAHTEPRIQAEAGHPAVLTAARADAIVAGCRLIESIATDYPELVTGPLPRDRQHWIGTGSQGGSAQLGRTRFVVAAEADLVSPSTKPFGLGLYSSTVAANGRSMWRTYLDLFRGSTLHPLPWQTWLVEPSSTANVLEVTSADDWVAFLARYPRTENRLVYPDWRAAADEIEAVHLTLAAVVATQGFSFPTVHGLTAPAYWDLESTLWLRWCFIRVALVGVAE